MVEKGEGVLLAGSHADHPGPRPLYTILPEEEGGSLMPGAGQVGTELEVPAKLV